MFFFFLNFIYKGHLWWRFPKTKSTIHISADNTPVLYSTLSWVETRELSPLSFCSLKVTWALMNDWMRAGTCHPSVDSRKLLCNAGDYGETSGKTASIMEVEIQKLALDSVSSTSPVLPARLLFLLLLHCCLLAAARHPLSHILHPSSKPPAPPIPPTPPHARPIVWASILLSLPWCPA